MAESRSIARIDADVLLLTGDVHGRADRLSALLAKAGMAGGVPAGAAFVQLGDLVDRGRYDERLAERAAAAVLPVEPRFAFSPLADGPPVPLEAALDGRLGRPGTRPAEERGALLGALDSLAAIRALMALERSSAGAAIALMGNHELDLLRGRFLYARREKAYLLALLGWPPEAAARHAASGLPLAEVAASAPELDWLARRPIVAAGRGLVAVHGGPTREAVAVLERGGPAGLGAWLDAARGSLDAAIFEEGASPLSPERPEDDFVGDADLRERFLAPFGATTLAVGHSAFLHAGRSERPAFLAAGAVLKLDADAKRAGPLWLVRREAGRWSAIAHDGARLDLDRADATPDAPSAGEVGDRLFAVHGSAWPPEGGVLQAGRGARRAFGPCVHFALGGLSRGMDGDGAYRFAVVAPLRALARQLVSLSPADSFALGDVVVTPEMTVVAPEGADLSGLAAEATVARYSAETGLAEAVRDTVRARRGWDVVSPASFDFWASARIERREIGTAAFFDRFLAAHPHVAFGGHAASERGEAALYGMVDRLLQGLARRPPAPGRVARFAAAAARCFLDRLMGAPLPSDLPQAARAVLIDAVDEALRRLDEGEAARAIAAEAGPLDEAFAGEVLSVLPRDAMSAFLAARPELFEGTTLPRLVLEYATLRWLTVGTARALEEGLHALVDDAFPEATRDGAALDGPWRARLAACLAPGSNRAADARAIAERPAVEAWLARRPRRDAGDPPEELTVAFKSGRRPDAGARSDRRRSGRRAAHHQSRVCSRQV